MAKDLVNVDEVGINSLTHGNPIENINLSDEDSDNLLLETVGESFIGLFPFFDKIGKFLDSYQQKIDKAKLIILLKKFEDRHDNSEKFQEALKKLLTSPYGLSLFQKILRIVNANAVNLDYIKTLAIVLKRVSDSEFKDMFEEHNYVLSQIEKLTPQALLLLSDKHNWPGIDFPSTTTSGITSGKGWDTSFSTLYSNRKNMSDDKSVTRIAHSINELKNNHLVGLERDHLPLTVIGEEIFRYLS
jgi:hypothetical protein